MDKFVHLQCHTEFSIEDGLLRIKSLVNQAKEYGMKSVAITDLNNMFAMVKFYKAAISAGIKPIIGSDVYIEDLKTNITLLCANNLGYKNLTKLISDIYLNKKIELIEYSEGLIAILNNIPEDKELAESTIEYWQGLFDNRFYLAVARIDNENEEKKIKHIIETAELKQCPVVATNCVRFIEEGDFEAHEARVCINSGYELEDPKRPRKYTNQQYFKTQEEMLELFSDIPEVLENSVEISKRCNLVLELDNVFLPNYPVPQGLTTEEFLVQESKNGLVKKNIDPSQIEKYEQRLDTELKVINSMGFAGYFLIVADFIKWSLNNDVPVGPGRGSGAGSLVAYALNITNIDPLPYDLLFERFLNPERVSMPDFDIDFCMEGRDRVIDYVAKKYGRESVSQIITYGTMAAKAVIRDVGRVLGHPYIFVDKIAKLIPTELGITLDKALAEEEQLQDRYNKEEEVKTLIDLAKKLEGVTRNVGKHAGGVVIAPSKLIDFCPLYADSQEGHIVTQFDKNDVETIGLVKFDFLGLRTLTIIKWALENIKSEKIDINKIPLDDPKTFRLLQDCLTTAVFQLESRGMKDLIKRMIPDRFEDIVALVALFRPGPLQSGMVDDFIDCKLGRAEIKYPHEKLEPILKPTYGIILYQEQVMQIAQVLAGYTLGAADMLRRAMGKKKPEEMAKQRDIFTTGAVERGVEEKTATYIFDLMEKFAGYGFNKSHSAAYALISFQTAWLKAHYPAEFMASVLSADMANTDKVQVFIEDCQKINIPVLAPNINTSLYKFSVINNEILYGLGAVKGVGEAAIENIINNREENGKYADLFDFCLRVDLRKVTKRVLTNLIYSGAMDELGSHRAELIENINTAIDSATQINKDMQHGQVDLFGSSITSEVLSDSIKIKDIKPFEEIEILHGEKQSLGLYLSGHPITQYEDELKNIISCDISGVRAGKNSITIAGFITSIRTLLTKKGDRMAFLAIDDKTGRQEIAVFSDLFRDNKELLKKDNLIIVEGQVTVDEYSGGFKMRAIKIKDMETVRSGKANKILINLNKPITEEFTDNFKTLFTEENMGTSPIEIHYLDNGVKSVLKLGANWKLRPTDDILDRIKKILPEGCGVGCGC